jgi:hypothetical protein
MTPDELAEFAGRFMFLLDKDWVYRAPETFIKPARIWWALANKNWEMANRLLSELESDSV